jgi:hypothetical protein
LGEQTSSTPKRYHLQLDAKREEEEEEEEDEEDE